MAPSTSSTATSAISTPPGPATIGSVLPVALIGRRLDEVFPAEIVARVRPFLDRAFAGETVTFPLSAFGLDYTIHAWPLPEPDGTVGAIAAMAQEVPARPRGAEDLTP